ncbi:MAG: SDR family NAD(P)-dependent oxidoreductase, partial [Pseudomonadota bacterium]|nr:SDR family NAD(P)-dependent oxidoreductase [Pseudomonadota bacterium]
MLATEGRVIMISGANRGIGRAIAETLFEAGYSISLGARDPESLSSVIDGRATDRVATARYDAEDAKTHQHWVEATVEKFGRIDGLVNNAGIFESVTVEDGDDAVLDRMWAVNV